MVSLSTDSKRCRVCRLHFKFLCILEPLQHLRKRLQVLHHHVVCENAHPAVQINAGLTDDPFARRVFLEGEVQVSPVEFVDLDAVVLLSLEQIQQFGDEKTGLGVSQRQKAALSVKERGGVT
ncbi:hypothetical protein B0H19DRAFT_1121549, partial [Mycena capillaripes]